MPKTIDIAGARALLHTRGELMERGLTERQVRGLVETKTLRKVRRGRYIFADDWNSLWNEGRHLVEVVAAHLNSEGSGLVFWGPSAAVIHALPLYRHAPDVVHVATTDARHGRARAKIRWHNVAVSEIDIIEIDGIMCTTIDRTVLDLARSLKPEAAISAADAALHAYATTGSVHNEDLARQWRERMQDRAERLHGRGIRQARRVIAFADGRAQSPGESVSRLHLSRLGFTNYDIQIHVVGAAGNDYWLDFGFLGARCFGEFDGKDKYVDEVMTRGRTTQEVILAEKRREDDIRGVTGWRTARWGSSDIATVDVFGDRLAAFGIRPPG
ncbi:hypothetical protein RS84_00462 [Microbacterium hydrocarbonoxydans]|uniref:Transcriptional regulator, AbiEi antitoxin, Type IV TA system n=1 Tax=Microbacterium hydrocarbonoxydans TaxID=273678 RepID=A0A0M2HWL5_9MICO|nr:hypothetical protein [Microbacterium hydrocarbonoxydans]KJL48834.1 hypothetical protein RS84_00462 [Microbacterium hydrocarbonoxydans]